MDYKEFKNLIVDYITGNLEEAKQKEFEDFLLDNPNYNEEFEATTRMLDAIDDEAPMHSELMDKKFYELIKSSEKTSEKTLFLSKLEKILFGSFPKQLAFTLVVLTIGFFVGNELKSDDRVEVAQQETENVRSQLVLTLLDQPSANKRLQAVNEVNKLNKVTETIIKALFSTLNNDPNVNVRLSAIEALKNYTEIPLVREGLVASIIHQKSPLVQVELADLMVVLQEKKAVQSFKKLLKEEDVNTSAKEKMEESIKSIL